MESEVRERCSEVGLSKNECSKMKIDTWNLNALSLCTLFNFWKGLRGPGTRVWKVGYGEE